MRKRLLCLILSAILSIPVSVSAIETESYDTSFENLLSEVNQMTENTMDESSTTTQIQDQEMIPEDVLSEFLNEPEMGNDVLDESYLESIDIAEYMVNIETDHCDVVILNGSDFFSELEMIEFTMFPEPGYEIVDIMVDDGEYLLDLYPGGDEYTYSFLMPASDVNLSVSAVPKEEADNYTGNGILMLTEDNVENIEAVSEEDKEILNDISNGNLIAFAPVSETGISGIAISSETVLSDGETYTISTLASDSNSGISTMADEVIEGTYTLSAGGALFIEEVYTVANSQYPCVDNGSSYTDSRYRNPTVHRAITYTDSNGDRKQSPLYCIEAMKTGNNQKIDIPTEAISFITNSTMKKILYYGYSGPGDICDDYDPTCSHVDWTNWHARFLYTHYALSYIYCGDIGNATNTEVTHIGLFKFIDYIKALKVPSHTNVKLKSKMADGNAVTSDDLSVEMVLYRTKPDTGYEYLPDTYDDGFQCTRVISVVDTINANNGITIKKKDTNIYDLAFWENSTDYNNGVTPTVIEVGKTYKLKKGYYFKIFYPKTYTSDRSVSYNMILQPVQYLLIDGDKVPPQRDTVVGYQDFAAFVYQGTRGKVKLNLDLAEWQHVKLIKKCSDSGTVVSGATYKLVARDAITMAGVTIHKKESVLDEFKTNSSGVINFKFIPPGRYYIQETVPATGYILDTTKHYITVGDTCDTLTVNVENIPDRKGFVKVKKVIEGTSINLTGAQFKVYAYNNEQKAYDTSNAIDLIYNNETKLYESSELVYTATNLGKFKVKEIVNPTGYKGTFETEFRLTKNGETENFLYTAENSPITEKIVYITKLDSKSKDTLRGAEFTIYEWDNVNQKYKTYGNLLSYNENTDKYESTVLTHTDNNQGKFLIKETRNPDGYSGEWNTEINISNIDEVLQFTVYNNPPEVTHGTISLEKRDSVTEENLSDAEFTIYQWNILTNAYENTLGMTGKLIYDDYKGLYESELLPITQSNAGRFKVVETKSPAGYTGSWETEITLTSDGENLNLGIVYNKPEKLPVGEITVTKRIKKSDINWNHGNPIFHFMIEGLDDDGKERKYESFVEFDGMESVDASGYVQASYTFYDIPLGTYKVYEKNVGRYYLDEVTVTTANAIVWKGNLKKGYGTDTSKYAGAEVKLTVQALKGGAVFTNEVGRFDEFSHRSVIKNRIPLTFS